MNVGTPASIDPAIIGIVTKTMKLLYDQSAVSTPLYQKITKKALGIKFPLLNPLGLMEPWENGQRRTTSDFKTRYLSVTPHKWGIEVPLSIPLMEADQIEVYSQVPEMLKQSVMLQYERMMAQCLKLGFGTSHNALSDGIDPTCVNEAGADEALFADSHVMGVSTIDNKVSGALTKDTLKEAIYKLKNFKFKANAKSDSVPLDNGGEKLLIVSPAEELNALEIVERKTENYGAENMVSKLDKIKVVVNKWLGDGTYDHYWYVANVGSFNKPFVIHEMEAPIFRTWTAQNSKECDDRDENSITVKLYAGIKPTFPHLIVGSTGT